MLELAKRWIEADMAEAFPEVPREVLEQFAERQAERVAQELRRPISEHHQQTGERDPSYEFPLVYFR